MKLPSRLLVATALLSVGLPGTFTYADDTTAFLSGRYAFGLRTMTMMHIIDTDKDGNISKEEWIAFQNRVFDALDKDKTGSVDAATFMSKSHDVINFTPNSYSRGLRTQAMFNAMDTDHDGRISRQEFLDYQMKIFDMMDTGKKGRLSLTDFIAKH